MSTYKELLVLLDKDNSGGVWEAIRLSHPHSNKTILDTIARNEDGNIVIDGTALELHTHGNLELLGQLDVSAEGKLTLNGIPVDEPADSTSVSWGEIPNRPDKVVVSIQGSDNNVKVVYDDTSVDELNFSSSEVVKEVSNPLTTTPLEYGYCILGGDTSLNITQGDVINISKVVNGNIKTNGNDIYLNGGKTYSISMFFDSELSTLGSISFALVNKETGEVVGQPLHTSSVTNTGHYARGGSIQFTIDSENDFICNVKCTYITVRRTAILFPSNIVIQEIRNNPVNQYGGFETEVLFEGSANTIGGTFNLVDKLSNYSALILSHTPVITVPQDGISNDIIYVKDISVGTINNICIQGFSTRRTTIYFTSETSFKINAVDDPNYYPKITKIVGVKGQLPSLLVGGEF